MNRLGVFVFYDKGGIVDRYIEFLLEALQKNLQKIVIVINGSITEEGYQTLLSYTPHIFERENVGFDAGAYKDFFLHNLCNIEWQKYDEVVMLNDTFYGPLTDFEKFFSEMTQEPVHFWGMTRHPDGVFADGQKMQTHIQGYFLVVKKEMLRSKAFLDFWRNMSYPENYQSAIKKYEVEFTAYFNEQGFIGKSWMDIHSLQCLSEDGENPYLLHSFQLLSELKIPFLKKKSLSFGNAGYNNAVDALEYIEENTVYDTNLIWENILRLSREGTFQAIFNYWELEEFYGTHERIFIYGAGVYGKKMRRYFQYRKWTYESFLVTKKEDICDGCICYTKTMIGKEDGVILALGKNNLYEVLELIGNDISEEQMLLPSYC